MAQEVLHASQFIDKYLAVDYSKIDVEFKQLS